MTLGAIILTGGASSRMGADKADALWLGVRAVDRVAALAADCEADPVITVGAKNYGLAFVADDDLGGGPVGGVIAGVRALKSAGCRRALILAVDAPTLRAAAPARSATRGYICRWCWIWRRCPTTHSPPGRFRAPLLTPRPTVYGPHTAKVVGERNQGEEGDIDVDVAFLALV
eukprot:gene39441-53322_t